MATIVEVSGKKGMTYKAIIRVSGHPSRIRHFKSKTKAKDWATQKERDIRNGETLDLTKQARLHTIKDVFDRYRRVSLPAYSPQAAREAGYVMDWWDPRIGHYTLATLSPEIISDFLHQLSTEGDRRRTKQEHIPPRKKARATIKQYRDTLSRVLKAAVHWRWAAVNPVDEVPRIKKLRNQRLRYLSEDEREALFEACAESENRLLYPIVIFAISTGARKSEILNLKLDDVDLDRNIATFHETKNGERRGVPINSYLRDLLKAHVAEIEAFYADVGGEQKWLFPRKDGLAPIDIRKAWENARREAKLKDFRFHDLRHTAASYLAMNGATLLEIAAVLGHKTLQMVKRYSHISEQHTAQIVEKMNDAIFAGMGQTEAKTKK